MWYSRGLSLRVLLRDSEIMKLGVLRGRETWIHKPKSSAKRRELHGVTYRSQCENKDTLKGVSYCMT